MRAISLIIASFFIVAALAGGFIVDASHPGNIHSRSCCDTKCNSSAKCHDTVKVCLCNYLTTQVLLAKAGAVFKFIPVGNLIPEELLAYHYRLSEDIFHPPRA